MDQIWLTADKALGGLFLWSKVSSPGWLWTLYVVEDDLKLLFLLSLPPRCWIYGCSVRHPVYTVLGTEAMYAEQELYQLSYDWSPSIVKFLLESNHVRLFMYCLWLLFNTTAVNLNSNDNLLWKAWDSVWPSPTSPSFSSGARRVQNKRDYGGGVSVPHKEISTWSQWVLGSYQSV